MSSEKPTLTFQSSFPVASFLGVLFVGLKLTGHIAWSWWWVLSPFWIPIVIVLVLVAVAGLIAVGASK